MSTPVSHEESSFARWELPAVLLTGVAHLFFEEVLEAKALFIALAVAFWGTYVAVRVRRQPQVLALWGFRRDGIEISLRAATVVFVVAAGGMALAAVLRGTLTANPHMLPLLVVYPLWGWVQHFLLQALVARNLVHILHSPWAVTPIAAIFFGLIHWPDEVLMVATFLLALCFTPIYLRWRNLWPLGIYHGWLGVLAYYWILRRDPWQELLGGP